MPETLLIPIYRVCGLLLPPVLLISITIYISAGRWLPPL
jgi:hypothetical protein